MDINLTLLGEMITFLVFVWITMRYIWPPIINAMRARQKKIADGLAAGQEGEHKLAEAKEHSEKILKETKSKASDIIEQANSRASQIVDDGKARGKVEQERMIKNADVEIQQQAQNVKESIRQDVANLVYDGVKKVMGKEVDQKVHDQMLTELAEEILK